MSVRGACAYMANVRLNRAKERGSGRIIAYMIAYMMMCDSITNKTLL